MAYIYRYQLTNRALRESTFLREWESDIRLALERFFQKNLKDSIIQDQYFEFSLYVTVSNRNLQEMGRALKAILPSGIFGFVRTDLILYAMVYQPQRDPGSDNNSVHVELIDTLFLENPELFLQRAKEYFYKATDRSRESNDPSDNDLELQGVIKNFYINILEAYVDNAQLRALLQGDDTALCYQITASHRHNPRNMGANEKNAILLEECRDVGSLRRREEALMSNDSDSIDYLFIRKLKPRRELIERIECELSMPLNEAESIDALQTTDVGGELIFTVHNTGQAFAASLSRSGQSPFVYFDYGMPFGRNAHTKPPTVNMPTVPGSAVILSHTDKDHWYRLADDLNGYLCHWFIANQPLKYQLRHKLAEIIASGGSVQTIQHDVSFLYGRITSGSPLRPNNHITDVHKTGLTMRLEMHDITGKHLNILLAGDQQYKHIDPAQLQVLDVLVASHHGGSSGTGTLPKANSPHSIIVYSYGNCNTYGHPTQTHAYRTQGWTIEHHTPTDGDFKLVCFL